jgi:CHASE3 domain sensor protein
MTVGMSSAARQLVVVGLLLVAVVALFLAAESGQRQLAAASRRVEMAAQREHALSSLLQVLSQAESGQRGYILTADPAYLAPYREGTARLEPEIRQLTDAFAEADSQVRADLADVVRLSRAKFVELRETLDLYRDHGRSAAVALISTDIGQKTMVAITDRVGRVQAAETSNMLEASRSWRSDRCVNLAIRVAALLASLFLVVLLRRLVLRYMIPVEAEERRARRSLSAW